MIRSLWLLLFVAAFRAAFAVSGMVSVHHGNGLAKLDGGDCSGAVSELLAARADGDTSNSVMLGLSRALECDNRLVDALSATFADNKVDTTGRIELLLFRAHLLRRVGLADEAEKVETEIGVAVVGAGSEKTTQMGKSLPQSVFSWTIGGSTGWGYQGDVKKSADSLGIYLSWMKANEGPPRSEGVRTSRIIDSVTISGAQVPVSVWGSLDLYGRTWNASLIFPAQTSLATDFKSWLAAAAGVDLGIGYEWAGWLGMDFGAGWSRNWSPIADSDPLHSDQLSVNATLRGTNGKFSWTAPGAVTWNTDPYGFDSRRISQSLGIGMALPRDFKLDVAGSWSIYRDGSRLESYDLEAWIVPVENAFPHQPALEIVLIDTNGVRLRNTIEKSKVLQNLNQRAGRIDPSYSIPYSSPQDWDRWGASFTLSHSPSPAITWFAGFDLARTELTETQLGTLIDPIESWDLNRDVLRVFRDDSSGIDYVSYQATGASIVPLFWARRRVDIATTFRVGTRFVFGRNFALRGGWSFTENSSSLKHILDFASYTRSVWNLSASVAW